MRSILTLAALAALAACNGETAGGNGAAPAAPAAGAAAPNGGQWTEVVSVTPEGGYRMGNPDAPIKLVEYGSRTCPTCGLFGREGNAPLASKYVSTGKVSFEYRDFLVHGAPDLAAALLGACGGTATFFPILEQMYQNQQDYLAKLETGSQLQAQLQGQPPERITVAWAEQMGLIDFVKQRGIPEAKARACLTDKAAIEALAKRYDTAAASGQIAGTPTFLINGQPAAGVVTWDALEPALKAAGA